MTSRFSGCDKVFCFLFQARIDISLCVCVQGCAGLMYIGGVCLAARLRDKDDYRNCGIGGMMASIPFGLYCESLLVGVGGEGLYGTL